MSEQIIYHKPTLKHYQVILHIMNGKTVHWHNQKLKKCIIMIIIKKLEYNLSPFKSGMNQINSDLQCMFNMIVHMHGIKYSVISNYIKLMVYLHLNVPTDN